MIDSLDSLRQNVGQEIGVSEWFVVSQERIQQFADATLDHQWIHVDRERARRESPFQDTIAHGFLTLSLVPHFVPQVLAMRNSVRMGVNYGLNHVRFVSPVIADSKIRARFVLQSLKDVSANCVEAIFVVTIEAENSAKPRCVAEWVVRYYT